MSHIAYMIVPHEDGWAYKLGEVFSEKFATRDEALKAAEDAAARQELPGPTETISWQDAEGRWHEETAPGDDRPTTRVESD